jgi:DNA-binding response OmpR family regulator
VARVLVVEDERAIRDGVMFALEGQGHEVLEAGDGVAALELAEREDPDLVILDVVLPRLSGYEVARRLRASASGTVPIIMLSARSGEDDRVTGLEAGADDYVAKPFSLAELLARVHAQLRRRELDDTDASVRRVGALELDLERQEARLPGLRVRLTSSETRVLGALSRTPGQPVARDDLVRELWSSEHTGDRRACDTHIVNIRRKLADPDGARIATVHGVGYVLHAI